MSYVVNILPEARADFDELFGFIAKRSFQGAVSWEDAFEAALERIERDPYTCGTAPDDLLIGRGLRQLLFGTKSGLTYRAVFIIEGKAVTILRIRGPGQDLLKSDELPDA